MIEKFKFNFQNVFAICIFGSVFYYFLINPDPTVNETYKSILLIIVGYIFGSSKSSASKDIKIDELQRNMAANNNSTAEVINTENISGNVTAEKVVTNETKTDETE